MLNYKETVYKGLKKASGRSDRQGKWATPPEVRSNSNQLPQSSNVRNELMKLVRENKAEKKKGVEFYRPANMGGAGNGDGLRGGYRSPNGDRTNDGGRTPTERGDGGKDGRTDRGTGAEDTTRLAIGMMIGGSVAPSSGTGTSTGGSTFLR